MIIEDLQKARRAIVEECRLGKMTPSAAMDSVWHIDKAIFALLGEEL